MMMELKNLLKKLEAEILDDRRRRYSALADHVLTKTAKDMVSIIEQGMDTFSAPEKEVARPLQVLPDGVSVARRERFAAMQANSERRVRESVTELRDQLLRNQEARFRELIGGMGVLRETEDALVAYAKKRAGW